MMYNSEDMFIEKHTYTWILPNFFSVLLPKHDQSVLMSPPFGRNESKYQWQIKCYPNGNRRGDRISLYLAPLTTCEFPATYIFYMRNSEDETLYQKTFKKTSHIVSKYHGYSNFAMHDNLWNIADDILKINVVILIEIVFNHNNLLEFPKIKLAQDLKAILKQNHGTDFILKVDDFELPVHKVIIAARSPVFFSMLTNDTLEKEKSCMQINDIDKETLILLIDFIYTGHVNELSYTAAGKLLYAANKYMLLDLGKICENELTEKLKVSNVGDILILADLHNALNLKTEAINFIVKNHWKFVDNALLQKVAEKSPKLLLEVISKLTKAVPRKIKMAEY